MTSRPIAQILLWGLLLVGLYGAISVSWQTFTQASLCPAIGGVRVCYVVLICYLLMALAQLIRGSSKQNILFYSAWAVVFGFALFGSVLEWGNGNTCPKSSSGFAMCYASLMLSGSIGLLHGYLQRRISAKQSGETP